MKFIFSLKGDNGSLKKVSFSIKVLLLSFENAIPMRSMDVYSLNVARISALVVELEYTNGTVDAFTELTNIL
jgi:hypothetical protein